MFMCKVYTFVWACHRLPN